MVPRISDKSLLEALYVEFVVGGGGREANNSFLLLEKLNNEGLCPIVELR